ncbi:hypothetical protein ACLQ28_29875 [Micromonospora sp. DT201]
MSAGSTNGGYFINRVSSTTAAPLKAYWQTSFVIDDVTLQAS